MVSSRCSRFVDGCLSIIITSNIVTNNFIRSDARLPPVYNGLENLTPLIRENADTVQFLDINPASRSAVSYNGTVRALPLDTDYIAIGWRQDVFHKHNVPPELSPPRTVQDLARLAEMLNGLDHNDDGEGDWGVCLTPQVNYFYAFVAPILQTALRDPKTGTQTGQNMFFDSDTFEPFIRVPGFRSALELYWRIIRASNCQDQLANGEKCDRKTAFPTGRCAMVISMPGTLTNMLRNGGKYAPRPRTDDNTGEVVWDVNDQPLGEGGTYWGRRAPMPGSSIVQDWSTKGYPLVSCQDSNNNFCPLADSDGINFAPFFAEGGEAYALNGRQSKPAARTIMWDMFTWLSELPVTELPLSGQYRKSHLDEEHREDLMANAGWPEQMVDDIFDLLGKYFLSEDEGGNPVQDLLMLGFPDYMGALNEELHTNFLGVSKDATGGLFDRSDPSASIDPVRDAAAFEDAFNSFVDNLESRYNAISDNISGGQLGQLQRWRQSLNLPWRTNEELCTAALSSDVASFRRLQCPSVVDLAALCQTHPNDVSNYDDNMCATIYATSDGTNAAVIAPAVVIPVLFIAAILAYVYVEKKKRSVDAIWSVKPDELKFDEPPEIVGRGTFGLVLLAEYRGTQVAVKRVIPPKMEFNKGSSSLSELSGSGTFRRKMLGDGDTTVSTTTGDITLPGESSDKNGPSERSPGALSFDADASNSSLKSRPRESNGGVSLKFDFPENTEDGMEPSPFPVDEESGLRSGKMHNSNGSLAMTKTAGHASGEILHFSGSKSTNHNKSGFKSGVKKIFGFHEADDYDKLKADFIVEMRHLATLRHPCITTVMGAVIDKREEPMLVMEYMHYGSLNDLLKNKTVSVDGDMLLPILQDICQGLRFLHAADPQIIHGDLKSANILVDSKYRAKVADFGLSQKRNMGATGTPYWMAPELLRGDSENTSSSDVYSFGIILYEVYSRKDPYEGEQFAKVIAGVCDTKKNKRPPVPHGCPETVATIMKECVDGNANARPSFEELDLRLKRLNVESVEPGEMPLSAARSKKMKRDLQNADNLLYDIFPRHIADALREGRKVEPEHHECVTIFFSDIVGFTVISQKIGPMKVAKMLDRLYAAFDDLTHKHDIFKIETIGDAYLAVANLVKDQKTDHAKRVAEFSIDAIKAASEVMVDEDDPSLGFVTIRVGFHSGPVISDVVGTRLPKYGMFGDSINTASRMESNSIAGRIHCSLVSANLLREQAPDIPLVSRGTLNIKGKGNMETYFVNETKL